MNVEFINTKPELITSNVSKHGKSVIEIIKETINDPDFEGDPFYVANLDDIHEKYNIWKTHLPRVEPFYAVKCNTDKMLLKLLDYLGTGFDCASKSEIQTILELGVSPDRIIYAHPCKATSFIKYACKMGVNTMTFDNEDELFKIKANHPNARIVLRIVTNDINATCRLSQKFGANMAASYKLIDLAIKLNLDLVGISFHVGSDQTSSSVFSESIQNARILFDYAVQKHNHYMSLLDIGGGFPGYSDLIDLFKSIAKEINVSLDKYFPANAEHNVRIIAEPGRYFASSAFTFSIGVIGKRVIRDSSSIESIMYYLNDGMHGQLSNILFDHAIVTPLRIVKNEFKEKRSDASSVEYKSIFWGPSTAILDCVFSELYWPELEIGDFLMMHNMGAYTSTLARLYNGLPSNHKTIYIGAQPFSNN